MGALRLISVLGLGVGLTLTACGDDDSSDASSTGGTGETVTVKATDALKFEPDHLTATAGVIHIVLDNSGATPHTFVIDDPKFKLTEAGELLDMKNAPFAALPQFWPRTWSVTAG